MLNFTETRLPNTEITRNPAAYHRHDCDMQTGQAQAQAEGGKGDDTAPPTQCPGCEGDGEIITESVSHVCGLCHGTGAKPKVAESNTNER